MTVKKLKEMLSELGSELDNCQVIMARDSEGNLYSPVVDLTDTAYCDDASEYRIEAVYYEEHGYLGNCFDSKKEWESYKKKNDRVVVLHPMN